MKLDQLSEADISTKIIIPSVVKSGWNLNSQIREQYTLTKGRIKVFGKKTKREAPLRPDITLFDNNNGFNPIAVIEVKKADAPVGEGIQKAILYSEKLDIPFAFSTNGKEYLFHDKTDNNSETVIAIDKFPDFNFLIRKYLSWKKISNEKIHTTYYFW